MLIIVVGKFRLECKQTHIKQKKEKKKKLLISVNCSVKVAILKRVSDSTRKLSNQYP